MPIYDIKCLKCDEVAEILQRYAEEPVCPSCGGEAVRLPCAPKGIHGLEYRPYDALDRVIPDSKKIKSFANDRRKGGKDTT